LIFSKDRKEDGEKMSKENFKVFGQTKKCKVCQKDRKRTSFYFHCNSRDKLGATCTLCLKAKRNGVEIVPEPLSVSERIKNYFSEVRYDRD
jgi:hypothetical protein